MAHFVFFEFTLLVLVLVRSNNGYLAIGNEQGKCGNGIVDIGEECDCGSECTKHPCCQNCHFLKYGSVCRPSLGECDIPEICSGQNDECPTNTFIKNGAPCSNGEGYCFHGDCPLLKRQCQDIWDWMSKSATNECFHALNVGGHHNGHCGRDHHGKYRKCENGNVMCGTLHCKGGSKAPRQTFGNNTYTKIIIKLHRVDHECKSLSGPSQDQTLDQLELVQDGTKCGHNRICMDHACVNLENLLDNQKCPSNDLLRECSGNGDCSNINVCLCHDGWEGSDCSRKATISFQADTPPSPSSFPREGLSQDESSAWQPGKETKRQPEERDDDMLVMFGLLPVLGILLVLLIMTFCYCHTRVNRQR